MPESRTHPNAIKTFVPRIVRLSYCAVLGTAWRIEFLPCRTRAFFGACLDCDSGPWRSSMDPFQKH
jgi:hypothetical protein